MRRFVALFAVCTAVLVGSGMARDAAYCPPDAAFCPVPGGETVSTFPPAGSFGLGAPTAGQYAAFQSQLNEGETLLMVAPNIAADAYPALPYQAPFQTPYQNPYQAAAPAAGGMQLDFIPPPPGVRRPPAAMPPPAAPRAPVAVGSRPGATPVYAAQAPAVRQNRPPSYAASGPVRRLPPEAQMPGRKRKAEMLSEVANETSRKNPEHGTMRQSSGGRVPWWKGGLWRNSN